MKLHNSIETIFDKSDNPFINNTWTIYEHEVGASFRTVTIRDIEPKSYSIDSDLYRNKFKKVFENSSKLNDNDCDGCAIIYHNEKKYILLVEMKSKFDTNKISKAYKQALTTLLKNHMLFSLCDGYDVTEYDINILIACLQPDNNQKDWLSHQYMQMQNSQTYVQQDCCFATRLYFEKKIDTKMKDITFFQMYPFAAPISDLNIHITMKNPSTVNDTALELSINAVL